MAGKTFTIGCVAAKDNGAAAAVSSSEITGEFSQEQLDAFAALDTLTNSPVVSSAGTRERGGRGRGAGRSGQGGRVSDAGTGAGAGGDKGVVQS